MTPRSVSRSLALSHARVRGLWRAVVLGEQYFGAHATEKPLLVTAVYSAYVIVPLLLLARVLGTPQVFAEYTPEVAVAAVKEVAAPPKSVPKSARRATSPAKSGRRVRG